MKTVFVDTETTGFDGVKCAAIQLAAILDVDGVEVSRFDVSMRPFEGAEVSEDALKVSGNTLESVALFPPEVEGFAVFLAWLDTADKIEAGQAHFAGYNSPFDQRFVEALFKRNGREFGEFFFPIQARFDVLAIARRVIPRGCTANYKLGTIALHILGAEAMARFTETNSLHNAMTDIEVTRALYLAFTGAKP